jgi:hypothetical protein
VTRLRKKNRLDRSPTGLFDPCCRYGAFVEVKPWAGPFGVLALGALIVGFPFAPLAVGLFGLIGWLGPVGMAGEVGWIGLDEFGVPSDGVVPVEGGAVVAPGAAGLVTPPAPPAGLAPGPVPLGAPVVCAQSEPAVSINKQAKPDIFFISQSRS